MGVSSSATAAERLRVDPAVAAARAALIDACERHGRDLTGVRPAVHERRARYDERIAAAQAIRGGSLVYPYLASGIGRGALVELDDGSVKYDLIAGVGTHHLGHSHPEVIAASIDAAIANTVMEGSLQASPAGQAFAEEVLEAATESGTRLAHCFVTTSGAMACENALKISLQHRYPADRILAYAGCFTGRTLATAQVTDRPAFRDGLPELVAVDHVPFFDHRDPAGSTHAAVAALEGHLQRHPGRHAAMIFELILGEGGFYAAPAGFHERLMRTCREAGVLVLVDEVQTFLRTSRPFAYQCLGLDELIDATWVGKASQACATLFTDALTPRPGLVTQTFTASVSALFAGTAVIRHLRNGAFFGPDGRLTRLCDDFRGRIESLAMRHPDLLEGPFGAGAMVAFTPHGGDAARATDFLNDLFDRGVIALAAGARPTRARFLLPVGGIDFPDLEVCAEMVEQSLKATA